MVNGKKKSGFILSCRIFCRQIWTLFFDPVFVALTVFGNLFIILNGVVFYLLEKGRNDHLHSLLDGVWWAFSTVTTVGYGDVVPVTNIGKLHGIVLMVSGTAIFLSYTALFARALIERDIAIVEKEMKKVESEIKRMNKTDK